MKYTLLFICFCAIVSATGAQKFRFKSYTDKDGLSNNQISAVLQDPQGFVWVGTSNGLNRFDGNSFDNFYNDPSDTGSIAGNAIQCLFLDRKGGMWVGTNEGISLYHPLTQHFSNYAPDTTVLPVIGVTFQAICDDDQGNLWVGTKNDLLVFNPGKRQFTSSGWARFAGSVASGRGNPYRVIVLGIVKKNPAELWVLTTYGLFSVNTVTRIFKYHPYRPVSDFYGAELHYADSQGNVWITLYPGSFLCYNSVSDSWTEYQTPSSYGAIGNAYCITQFSQDTLMYCLGNSVYFFDALHKKVLSDVRYDPGEPRPAVATVCKNIIRQGALLWLGTNKGLVKMMPEQTLFHFHALASENSVDRVFRSSCTGNIIFSQKNTGYIQKNNGSIVPIGTSLNQHVQTPYQYFAEDAGGFAYLNDDEHFYVYNQLSNVATAISLPGKLNPPNSFDIRNMVIDKTGTVWIRTLGQGILKYQPQTGKAQYESSLHVSGRREINSLYYDSLTNRLWIAEEFNGVFVYDIGKKLTRHFLLNSFPSQRGAAVLDITGDGKGNIWMSSLQSGILQYDFFTGKFLHYTSHDGLPSDNTSWLCLDAKGFLWICTDVGLSRMDTATKKFMNYYSGEWFPAANASFLSRDNRGNLYMPYENGYYEWNTNDFANLGSSGAIYLRKGQLLNGNLPLKPEYHFSHSENSIQFVFGWLSFNSDVPEYIEYKLNNSPWLTTALHSNISFTHLDPGHYDLSLRAKNDHTKYFHIAFTIAAPFWQRWWFLALAAASICLIIFLVLRNRLNAVRRESSLKNLVIESEMSALRSQMNPHFVFNTLNSINSYIIENKSQEASDYLTDFGRLMRIILEHSRKKQITLEEEIHALKLYLELEFKRLEGSFDYRIAVQDELNAAATEIPALIIQPFVENAIWHGLRNKKAPGYIEIKIGEEQGKLRISVGDNGIGRTAAAKLQKIMERKSFGTAATIQRIRLADPGSAVAIEDLYDDRGEAAGTEVHILLTLKINR